MTEIASVEVTVWVPASPREVFGFFTDPDRYVQWMGSSAELDPVPGGVYRVSMADGFARPAGSSRSAYPHLVVFTWGFADDEAASRTKDEGEGRRAGRRRCHAGREHPGHGDASARRMAGPCSRCGTRTCPASRCAMGTTSRGTRTCRGSSCAPPAATPDPTRMPESGGPVRGAGRGHRPQEIAYECGALHKRVCRAPHSYISGSGRKGLSRGMIRVVRYRCVYSQAFPHSVAHGTTTMSHRRGPDHYRVTSSWLSLAPGVA